jgi:Ankyrin repeats (many copies)/Zinc finger, C3HC4 type (RING finger)
MFGRPGRFIQRSKYIFHLLYLPPLYTRFFSVDELVYQLLPSAKHYMAVLVVGYPVEWFGEQDVSPFLCAICQHVVRDVHETDCGHVFCRACIQKHQESVMWNQCPTCRQQPLQHRSSPFTARMIRNLRIPRCPWAPEAPSMDPCVWKGTLHDVDTHRSQCPWALETCAQCEQEFPRNQKVIHQNECPRRLVACADCTQRIPLHVMDVHVRDLCARHPVPCQLCHCVIRRDAMTDHRWSECPIACPNECKTEQLITRASLEAHLATCIFPCRNGCGVQVKHQEQADHLSTCPCVMQDCDYKHMGCTFRACQPLYAAHYQEADGYHRELVRCMGTHLSQLSAHLICTPQSAVKGRNMPLLQAILRVQVYLDINHMDADGETALHWAAFYHQADMVKLLMEHGADVNIRNRTGRTAFLEACDDRRVGDNDEWESTVLLLLSAKVDVYVMDTDGNGWQQVIRDRGRRQMLQNWIHVFEESRK